jgi:hypothetical protein
MLIYEYFGYNVLAVVHTSLRHGQDYPLFWSLQLPVPVPDTIQLIHKIVSEYSGVSGL